MVRPGSDDLLSAYFDHEVTPAERAAAEQLLESDPAARQELEEIGALSDLLKSLPRQSAPDFLAPAALQQAEREALLAPVGAPAAGAAGPRRRREWLVVLAGLLTTSAAVLLMLNTLPQTQHSTDDYAMSTPASVELRTVAGKDATELAPTAAPASPFFSDFSRSFDTAGKLAEVDHLQKLAAQPVGRASQPLAAEGMPSPAPRIAKAIAAPAPRAMSTGAPMRGGGVDLADLPTLNNAPDAPADATLAFRGTPGRWNDEANFTVAANNSIRLGQVIPYLARNRDGDVTVIEFTVIDVDQAADSLEVLLNRNDVALQQDAKSVNDKLKLTELTRKERGNQPENLVAFFLQTEPELAGQMLRQIESEPWVVKVDLMPPVPGNELVPEASPVDARQVEEVLVRNGIQYGNAVESKSVAQAWEYRASQTDKSRSGVGSGSAAGKQPTTGQPDTAAAGRRSSGELAQSGRFGDRAPSRAMTPQTSPQQFNAPQVVQRFALRQRPEVERLLGRDVAEASKPAARAQSDRETSERLYEKELAAAGNIRMLFILQQDAQPRAAAPAP